MALKSFLYGHFLWNAANSKKQQNHKKKLFGIKSLKNIARHN